MVASAFIGGPFAGFYLLRSNYKNLGEPRLAKKSLIQGIFFSFLLFTSLLILPQKITAIIPKSIFPLLYSMFLGMYADAKQGNEIKNHIKNGGKKYPGWKAAAVGISSLLLSILYILFLISILSYVIPGNN